MPEYKEYEVTLTYTIFATAKIEADSKAEAITTMVSRGEYKPRLMSDGSIVSKKSILECSCEYSEEPGYPQVEEI